MLVTLLYVILCYWSIIVALGYYFITKAFKKYGNQPKIEVKEQVQGLLRQDFNKWDQTAIKKGCLLKMPFKFATLFGYLFWLSLLSMLNIKMKLPAVIVELWRKYVGRWSNVVVFNLEQHFDWKEQITTPIVISNHTNMMDGNYLGSCFRVLSAIAKKDSEETPLFGQFMKYSQCLFVDRTSS